MTNKEKAIQIYNELSHKWDSLHYGHTIKALVEMAEWKDQQFKEFLEKKKNSIPTSEMELYDKVVYTEFIEGIINELFKED